MTTREKIIVGIMCLTIAYGAYDLLGSRRKQKSISPGTMPNKTGDLKSFVADVTGKLAGEKVSKEYQYMIKQAGAQWTKDPFIHSARPLKKRLLPVNVTQTPAKPSAPDFDYTGFMQLGTTRIAILNGMEYAEGEALPDKAYYIKSISPQRVIIGKVDSKETIQISINETDSL
jgi:hypothetical protein